MRITVNKQITRTENVHIKTVCDICGFETRAFNNWSEKTYDTKETIIAMEMGDSHPSSGGFIKKTSYDICPTCFENKLMPFLSSLGAEPEVMEYVV
jgi:hypothetical protein